MKIPCPCGGFLTPLSLSSYTQRPVVCVECEDRWIAIYDDDKLFIGLTREEWTDESMRLLIPLDKDAELLDEMRIDGRTFEVVQIDMIGSGGQIQKQIVVRPIPRALGVERAPQTDISGPRDASASFEIRLTPEVRAFYQHVFGPGTDEQARIRAEVEAMDWPEAFEDYTLRKVVDDGA